MSKHTAPIAIAAGGTGGHLFPAQSLSQELVRRGHKVVLFTDDRGHRFDELFPGVDVVILPAATFARQGLLGRVSAAWSIVAGVFAGWRALGRMRPAVMIGFGGYPTLPPLVAAKLRGVPFCLHEQNAVLGRVNKLMARWARAIASTFEKPKYLRPQDAGKLRLTGNPVRDQVRAQADAPYVAPNGARAIDLLVFGGSQGARIFSDVVPKALTLLPAEMKKRLALTQQCRPEDMARVEAAYRAAGIDALLKTFFDDMPKRIAQAHLVIGRSGASTVSELAVIGRPSLLVPLPHAIDNDQKANAETLVAAGAAWMMEQKDFNPEALCARLVSLFAEPEELAAAAAAAKEQGRPDAVRHLADLVEEFVSAEGAPNGVGSAGDGAPRTEGVTP